MIKLQERVRLHGLWLSGNPDGVRLDLRGTTPSETDLRGADLRAADLTGAKYDDNTQWPDGFDPEAAGAEKLD